MTSQTGWQGKSQGCPLSAYLVGRFQLQGCPQNRDGLTVLPLLGQHLGEEVDGITGTTIHHDLLQKAQPCQAPDHPD